MARNGAVVLAAMWMAAASEGCGGGGPSGVSTAPSGREANEPLLIARLNAEARAGAVTEVLHGVSVEDPYRSLEEDSDATRAWIDAQTERSARALEPYTSAPGLRDRITALMSIGTLSRPEVAGGQLFYLCRDADQEQAVLMVRPVGSSTPARALMDPVTEGERVAIDWYFPSPDGRLVAIGLSSQGSERSVLRVLDVATFQEVFERIEHCKWTTVSWLPDGQGFYYTRYPREGEPNYDANQQDVYYPRVFFHSLGSDPAQDELVYGADEPDDFPWPNVSHDGRHVVINVMRGWSRSDVYLLDRSADGEAALVTVSEGCDCLVSGAVRGSRLYLQTNQDHPRHRVVAADLGAPADQSRWQEVVPESEATIESFEVTPSAIVVHEQHEFASRVRFVPLDGSEPRLAVLPTRGSVDGLAAGPGSDDVALVFSSFFFPPTLLLTQATASELHTVEQVPADLDVDRYEVRQETVASADGTPINVFLVHRRGMTPDASHRVLLYGYGGFNISLAPSFSRRALYWLELGGIYAVANLRGGGELGEDWHRAGMLENKHHVFEDFEAVIRWLSSSGWSSPRGIAILGGSNGGLLVGATMTRCPDAFAAALGYVGLYDMVRYDRFPPAELWVSEYGTAREPDQFTYLHAYSPYHRLRPDVAYPAMLVETADHDTRVHWAHSTKFAARLQESSSRPENALFFMDRSVGHGAGTGRSDTIEQTIRLYAFLTWQLGLGRDGPESPAAPATEER